MERRRGGVASAVALLLPSLLLLLLTLFPSRRLLPFPGWSAGAVGLSPTAPIAVGARRAAFVVQRLLLHSPFAAVLPVRGHVVKLMPLAEREYRRRWSCRDASDVH